MRNLRFMLLLVALCLPWTTWADTVKVGTDIEIAAKTMGAAGYKAAGLAMGPRNPAEDIRGWSVDGGVLIAEYAIKDRKILRLSFWLADERAKSERMQFQFAVVGFDASKGLMTLQTRKPNQESPSS